MSQNNNTANGMVRICRHPGDYKGGPFPAYQISNVHWGCVSGGVHRQQNGFVPEFSDPDFLVLMFTPQITDGDIRRISACLCGVPARTPLTDQPPVLAAPKRRMSPREAIMSLQERIPAAEARGRILASASVNCPPAVPIAVCGEELDESAVRCFQYYGIEYVTVVK